jgi:hypothetical protein
MEVFKKMRAETLMVLLNFTPKNIKRNHPFWEKIIEMGVNIEQENIKLKEWERKFEYFRSNWRTHKNIIIDLYSYLKLNFPNAIPFPLFFSCKDYGYSNTEYNEYREDEFDDFGEKKNKHLGNKRPEELQFDEATMSGYDSEYDSYAYDGYNYYEDNEYNYDDESSAEQSIANLADKWLMDIFDGESFHENNKDYFTKTEVKHFLTCEWLEPDIKIVSKYSYMDLLEYYWKVKIRANELDLSSNFLVKRFTEALDSPEAVQVILSFFKFICINKRHIRDDNEIYNIYDFLLSGRFDNNFANITWQQLRHMSNEFHEQINNQRLALPRETIEGRKKVWGKTTIKDFTHIIDDETWTITEITTGELLYEEGIEMHNCVFSYIDRCISKKCAIFSVKNNNTRMATLEIGRFNSEFRLVQAKEKMNAPVADKKIKKIIRIWANENKIN